MALRTLSLCSGVGGLDLGIRLAEPDARTVCYVEWDHFAAAVIAARIEDAGLDRFAMMAMAQGGPVTINYAARNLERVTRLIFYGSYAAAMRDPTPEDLELSETFEQMVKVGWARPDSDHRPGEIARVHRSAPRGETHGFRRIAQGRGNE